MSNDETIVDYILAGVQYDIVFLAESYRLGSLLYNLTEKEKIKLILEIGARIVRHGWVDFGDTYDLDKPTSYPRKNVNDYVNHVKANAHFIKNDGISGYGFLPTLETPIITFLSESKNENENGEWIKTKQDLTFQDALEKEIKAMRKFFK